MNTIKFIFFCVACPLIYPIGLVVDRLDNYFSAKARKDER